MAEQDYTNAELVQTLMSQQAQLAQALAERPMKSYQKNTTYQTSTPRALQDMIKNRDSIRTVSRELDEALRSMEESPMYRIGSRLSNLTQRDSGAGWLAGFFRNLGSGLTSGADLRAERLKTKYENEMKDLAEILKYDEAMGDIQNRVQQDIIDYKVMPYSTSGRGGAGGTQEQTTPTVYDITAPEMPEVKPYWNEIDLMSDQLKDPETQARTLGGRAAKTVSKKTNPGGLQAMRANQQAYTNTFTKEAITEIAKKMGGSRGIDTIPELNIKGGPELAGWGQDSEIFESSVQDQAYFIADQIIKANPKTDVSREELANAIINNYNNSIRKDFRMVGQLPVEKRSVAPVVNQIARAVSQDAQPAGKYDYSKYGFPMGE